MFSIKKEYYYIFLLASIFLFGCSINLPLKNSSFSGDTKDNNKRVIALTSLTADLVDRLNSKSLLGIPGTSLLKSKEQFKDKVIVSQGRNPPSIEKIISLQPDLVLGAKGFHTKALSQLNDLGIETISTEIKNLNDLELLINRISKNLGVDNQSLLSLVPNCEKTTGEFPSRSTIVLVSSAPLLSPNKNSWAGSLLDEFNINNLISDIQSKSGFDGYVTLSPEVLLDKNPDNIVLIDTGNDMQNLFLGKSYTSKLKAVNSNNVYTFNYYGLVNPGSIESINNACRKLKKL